MLSLSQIVNFTETCMGDKIDTIIKNHSLRREKCLVYTRNTLALIYC